MIVDHPRLTFGCRHIFDDGRRVEARMDCVHVGMAFRKKLERAPHYPRPPFELEEQVVNREIEGVHHAILALVRYPERLSFVKQKLG